EKESQNLIPWEGHLTYIEIPSASSCVGKTLLELNWREQYGINVVLIERGNRVINVPGGQEQIFPEDRIAVIGTDDELETFYENIKPLEGVEEESSEGQMELMQVEVRRNSTLKGKDIRHSGIRSNMQGLVVGVE